LLQSYDRRDTAKTTDINPMNMDDEDELIDDNNKSKSKKKKISLVPKTHRIKIEMLYLLGKIRTRQGTRVSPLISSSLKS